MLKNIYFLKINSLNYFIWFDSLLNLVGTLSDLVAIF